MRVRPGRSPRTLAERVGLVINGGLSEGAAAWGRAPGKPNDQRVTALFGSHGVAEARQSPGLELRLYFVESTEAALMEHSAEWADLCELQILQVASNCSGSSCR